MKGQADVKENKLKTFIKVLTKQIALDMI